MVAASCGGEMAPAGSGGGIVIAGKGGGLQATGVGWAVIASFRYIRRRPPAVMTSPSISMAEGTGWSFIKTGNSGRKETT
jgi:hypothetical protein